MSLATDNLRGRVADALKDDRDRGALLRALEPLAREPAFGDCAELWAPALYTRDARFFEVFLLRHLDGNEDTIRALLPRAEADGHEALFAGLYRKVADEDSWNADLLALAMSPVPDVEALRAVRWRDVGRSWYALAEEPALALYRRNPALFGEFVREHVQGADRGRSGFKQLRAEALQRGDADLAWDLFRKFAEPADWAAALGELLRADVPAGAIVAELRRREPEYLRNLDAGLLADFLEKYGAAVLPYIEENVTWIGRKGASRLLASAERLGDDALYWRVFFRAGTQEGWNRALGDLAKQPLTDEAFAAALQRRTPPEARRGHWRLDHAVALALYRRGSALARPFLEQCLAQADLTFFEEAARANDEEFLDFLTARLMQQMSQLVYQAFPTASQLQYRQPDARAREELERLGGAITARLDRLYAQSPDAYVTHAASILGWFEATEGWSFGRNADQSPAFAYLYRQHRDAWCRSPSAMRDLLESPSANIQRIGLTLLDEGGADAAQRVVENLPALRAVLLGGGEKLAKKLALARLESAARASDAAAERILPLLEEALHFQGKRAIDECILVGFVRLRRLQVSQTSAPPPA